MINIIVGVMGLEGMAKDAMARVQGYKGMVFEEAQVLFNELVSAEVKNLGLVGWTFTLQEGRITSSGNAWAGATCLGLTNPFAKEITVSFDTLKKVAADYHMPMQYLLQKTVRHECYHAAQEALVGKETMNSINMFCPYLVNPLELSAAWYSTADPLTKGVMRAPSKIKSLFKRG